MKFILLTIVTLGLYPVFVLLRMLVHSIPFGGSSRKDGVRHVSTEGSSPNELVDPACPYCGVIQDPPPKRQKKCADCGQSIYVRKDGNRRRLMTETQVGDLENKQNFRTNNCFFTVLFYTSHRFLTMVLPRSHDLNCGRTASSARAVAGADAIETGAWTRPRAAWGFHVIRVASIGTARPKGRLIPSNHRPSQAGCGTTKRRPSASRRRVEPSNSNAYKIADVS